MLAELIAKHKWSAEGLRRALQLREQDVPNWLSGQTVPSKRRAIELDRLLGIPVYAWRPDEAPNTAAD